MWVSVVDELGLQLRGFRKSHQLIRQPPGTPKWDTRGIAAGSDVS